MTEIREFKAYPIGTKLLSTCLTPGIHEVVGHIESTWSMSERPWYALGCKILRGKPSTMDEKRYQELQGRFIQGAAPEREEFAIHVLNGGGSKTFFRLDDEVKMLANGDARYFYWGNGHWLHHDWDPGYGGSFYQPPEPESNWVCGSLGMWGEELEYHEPEFKDNDWLLGVAWYLRNYLEDHLPYPFRAVFMDRKTKRTWRGTLDVVRGEGFPENVTVTVLSRSLHTYREILDELGDLP